MSTPNSDRKIPPSAKLKLLAPEVRARIAEWCESGTLESACARCGSELGISVRITTMSGFRRWQRAESRKERSKATLAELFQRADANAKAVGELLRETGATADQLAAAEMLVFQLQATQAGEATTPENLALSIELEKLRIARESARVKTKHEEAKLRQKDREIAISETKLAELLLDKARSAALLARADEINAQPISNAEKIAAMRRAAFADIDALQASGKVVIPK